MPAFSQTIKTSWVWNNLRTLKCYIKRGVIFYIWFVKSPVKNEITVHFFYMYCNRTEILCQDIPDSTLRQNEICNFSKSCRWSPHADIHVVMFIVLHNTILRVGGKEQWGTWPRSHPLETSFAASEISASSLFGFLAHIYMTMIPETDRTMEFYSETRVDGLRKRVETPQDMKEYFEGRSDFLNYRHTEFGPRAKKHSNAFTTTDSNARPILVSVAQWLSRTKWSWGWPAKWEVSVQPLPLLPPCQQVEEQVISSHPHPLCLQCGKRRLRRDHEIWSQDISLADKMRQVSKGLTGKCVWWSSLSSPIESSSHQDKVGQLS